MENLNAEKVKKALEIHTGILDMPCEECPYNCDAHDEICLDVLAADILALINSQEQRIGELAKENERLTRLANLRQRDLDNANDLLFKAEDENERLRAKKEHNAGNEKYILSTVMVAPIDYTLEEYRKRVYSKMEKYTVFGREYIQRIMREVAKEMLEGKNEN